MSGFVIRAKAFIRAAVRMATACGKIHPSVAHQIERRRLFRQLHWMMHGQSVDRDTESKAFGSLRRGAEHNGKNPVSRKKDQHP